MKSWVWWGMVLALAGLVWGCERRAQKFYELGRYFEDRGQFGQAAVEYQKALDEDPTFVEAQYRLGRAYRGANMLEQAEAAYNQTLKLDPRHAGARIDLAGIYFSQGKLEAARELALKARELAPGDIQIDLLLGGVLLQEEKYREAAEHLEKVLVQDPKNAEVHYALAFAYFFNPDQDRKEDGLKELHKAGELGYPIQNARLRFDQELRLRNSSLQELEKKLKSGPAPTPAAGATVPAEPVPAPGSETAPETQPGTTP